MAPPAFKRSDRVAGEVRDVVTALLREKVSDPRLKGVYVTRVEMPRDMHVAWVGWHFLTDVAPARVEAAEKAFKKADGLFGAAIARVLKMKRVPSVAFRYDSGIDHERHIEALLAGDAPKAPAENKDPDAEQ